LDALPINSLALLKLKMMEADKTLTPVRTIDIEAENALIADMKRIYEMGNFDLTLIVKGMYSVSVSVS
jgi:hypothetical protein